MFIVTVTHSISITTFSMGDIVRTILMMRKSKCTERTVDPLEAMK